jgi:hypothetical protein
VEIAVTAADANTAAIDPNVRLEWIFIELSFMRGDGFDAAEPSTHGFDGEPLPYAHGRSRSMTATPRSFAEAPDSARVTSQADAGPAAKKWLLLTRHRRR